MISVVTPCRIVLWARPSVRSDSVDHESMLMKPGATARPVASIGDGPAPVQVIAPGPRDPITAEPDVHTSAGVAAAVVDVAIADDDVEVEVAGLDRVAAALSHTEIDR